LGSGVQVAEGEEVFRTKELLSLPVGEEFLGRVINPIGEIIDDFGKNVIPQIQIVCVPGNHDVNWAQAEKEFVNF
jgi:F0F1-type ATP synthase alpha subunit